MKEGAFCGAVQMCGKRCKNEQVKGIQDVFDTAEHREIRQLSNMFCSVEEMQNPDRLSV